MERLGRIGRVGLAAAAVLAAGGAQAQGSVMYRCPGNEYSNTLTSKQAHDRGCKTLEGAPITVIQTSRPRAAATPSNGGGGGAGAAGASGAAAAAPSANRVDPAEQRARDSDARRILDSELKRQEDQLAALRTEYNNGQPERQGNEKNYQKYIDRVAEMKTAIERKESDIAALKREIGKQP